MITAGCSSAWTSSTMMASELVIWPEAKVVSLDMESRFLTKWDSCPGSVLVAPAGALKTDQRVDQLGLMWASSLPSSPLHRCSAEALRKPLV
jgi:hypothetical protein